VPLYAEAQPESQEREALDPYEGIKQHNFGDGYHCLDCGTTVDDAPDQFCKPKYLPGYPKATPAVREALTGVTAYQCLNGDLYIVTDENLIGAVHHFYRRFPEHTEQFGPLKPLTILSEGGEK
jgi:hypothetical protein